MITILSQPNSNTFANSRIPYLVSSDMTAMPEFSYLMELTVGGVLLSTRRLSPDNFTNGDFEIGRILAQTVSPDFGVHDTDDPYEAVDSVKTVVAVFHEEWRVSGLLTRAESVTSNTISVIDADAPGDAQDLPTLATVYPVSLPTNHRLHTTSGLWITLVGNGWTYSLNGGSPVNIEDPTNLAVFLNVGPQAMGLTTDYTVNVLRNGVSQQQVSIEVYETRSHLGDLELIWWDGFAWNTYIADQEGTLSTAGTDDMSDQRSLRTTATGYSNMEEGTLSVLLGDQIAYRSTRTKPETKQTRWFSSLEQANYFQTIFDAGRYVYRKIGTTLHPLNLTNVGRPTKPIQRAPGQFNYNIEFSSALKERTR